MAGGFTTDRHHSVSEMQQTKDGWLRLTNNAANMEYWKDGQMAFSQEVSVHIRKMVVEGFWEIMERQDASPITKPEL